MGKTIGFLAESQGSATIDVQKASMSPEAYIVLGGRQSFNKLGDLLARSGLRLEPGDRVAIHDLSCIALSTGTLVRMIGKMLRSGVAFEIISAGILIEPKAEDKLYAFVRALDGHHRFMHGLKTHSTAASRGRKRLLSPDELATIKANLDRPGATATEVAKELGVSRSTLFNFLRRYDLDRTGGNKEV